MDRMQAHFRGRFHKTLDQGKLDAVARVPGAQRVQYVLGILPAEAADLFLLKPIQIDVIRIQQVNSVDLVVDKPPAVEFRLPVDPVVEQEQGLCLGLDSKLLLQLAQRGRVKGFSLGDMPCA
jgi:hypothetical protein